MTSQNVTVAHISELIGLFLDDLERRGTASYLQELPYSEYLRTAHWQEVRTRALAYAEFKCQLCARSGVELHVHHNTYERLGAERPSDLVVLCAEHHAKFHDKERPK